MKWFKHDSNAQADAKLERLIIRHGLEGYGLYWYCLELIVGNIESHNLTFELEHDAEVLAHRLRMHVDKVNEMMAYMIDLGLFEINDQRVTCLKLAKRLDSSMTSNPKFRQIIKESHDAVMMPSAASHDSVMQEEKRREEKRRVSRFAPPSVNEVAEYAKSKGYSINATKFVNYYEANGWMVGRTKMKSWKHAVANWASNDFNKSAPLLTEVAI